MPTQWATPYPTSSKILQLYVWHAEQRFLFIAAAGGAHDLVKEQPISDHTLEVIRKECLGLSYAVRETRLKRQLQTGTSSMLDNSAPALGKLIRRLVLHPDIRDLLATHSFSEVCISTNEYSIPWELIASNGSFLSLECTLTRRLQTSRPLAVPTKILFRNQIKALVAYNPTDDLSGTEEEAETVIALLQSTAKQMQVTSLSCSDCTRLNVLRMLEEVDIFHYAGHAFFNPERPKESGLILADGHLLASEIENYLGRSAPTLVFLNACESTAFGSADEVISGREMASLAHPFINAGSEAVIGSFLPVGDDQAAFFSSNVYDRFVKGESLGVSVLNARKRCVEQFGLNDATWSSFILFGNSDLRAILDGECLTLDHDLIRDSTTRAIKWLRSERYESGVWCDRVYRNEGPMNVAEIALSFFSADEPLSEEEFISITDVLFSAPNEGFTAYPYEPHALGAFTSCIALVLRALVRLYEMTSSIDKKGQAARLISECAHLLLALQESGGGWPWGAAGNGAGSYTLFTVEAMEALEECVHLLVLSDQQRVKNSLASGILYLLSSQRSDGGWSFRERVVGSDPTSTCYALTKLLEGFCEISHPAIQVGLSYLKSSLNFLALEDDQFFLDHRIEISNRPRSEWPHFEDYSGISCLFLLVATEPRIEESLGVSGLLKALLRQIASSQDRNRGWPKNYSTIYATAFALQVLKVARDKNILDT